MRLACEEARSLFEEELSGSLDELRAKALAEHLAGCAACQAERAELAPLMRLLAAEGKDGLAGLTDPGPAYWNAFASRVRVRRAAEGSVPKGERGLFGLSWLTQPRAVFGGAVAFAASVAVLVLFYGAHGSGIDIDPETVAMYEQFHTPEPYDGMRDLSAEEVDAVEDSLLAASTPAKKASPTPIPASTATPKGAPAARAVPKTAAPENDAVEDTFSHGGTLDLDDLSPEEMDQLLDQLGAKKT